MLVIPDTICQSLLERPQVTRSCWYSAAVRGYCHHCHHCHWRLNTGRCRISHCSSLLLELSTNLSEVSKGSPAKWAFKQVDILLGCWRKDHYQQAAFRIFALVSLYLLHLNQRRIFLINGILLIFKRSKRWQLIWELPSNSAKLRKGSLTALSSSQHNVTLRGRGHFLWALYFPPRSHPCLHILEFLCCAYPGSSLIKISRYRVKTSVT